MSFGPGALNASEVRVGTTPATAVYLGTEKVWPIYVGNLSPWYSPGAASGATGEQDTFVPWPAGAEFCDVVSVSGGAGGTGTGVAGNDQRGGGEGVWAGYTWPRLKIGLNHPDGTPTTEWLCVQITIRVAATAGQDGVGGGNFNTEAADGSSLLSVATYQMSNMTGNSVVQSSTSPGGLDKTSNTNNRNGGNVAPTFTFNGRTYTLASYGAGAGQGGATGNKNGGPGARPGGGGQSADDGDLTGYNAGSGAHGAAILYWY